VTNALSNAFYPLVANPSNYVDKTVTNSLPDAGTLAGKATTNQNVSLFPNDAGYVTASVINGLATTNYVTGQGYVTSIITNAFATTNQNVSLFSNDIGYVTKTITNEIGRASCRERVEM